MSVISSVNSTNSKQIFYLDPNSLLDHARDRCDFDRLPEEVQKEIERAATCKIDSKGVHLVSEYRFTHLSKERLIQLYQVFLSFYETNPNSQEMAILLFDIEDHIFRQIVAKPQVATEYKCFLPIGHPLLSKMEAIAQEGSRFYDVELKEGKDTSKIGNFQLKQSQIKNVNPERPLRVIKVGLENRRNFIGGVGAVEIGLSSAYRELRKHVPNSSRVYALFPLYTKDKTAVRNFEFQGILTHQFEGMIVQSSIYKNKETLEYVIEPDPRFREVFNIPPKEGVYCSQGGGEKESSYNDMSDRILYLGSAAAAFAGLYRGKKGEGKIDALQIDAITAAGCAFPVLDKVYHPMRADAGLPNSKKVVVWHDGRVDFSSSCLKPRIEALQTNEITSSGRTDLMEDALRGTDRVVFVSSELASRFLSDDPAVNKGRRSLVEGENKAKAIRNGIDVEKYDPANEQVFKELALKRTFDADGIETTDFVAYRAQLKQMLFEAGLIGDPKLPLVSFMGRYSPEKGVDVLVDMIKKSPTDVQFSTIGIVQGGAEHLVKEMQEMERGSHKDRLRVITTLDQQNGEFVHKGKRAGVKVALLLRAAADFVVVPSHVEAVGLVALEGQTFGSLLIAPYHMGFKSVCEPDGYDNGKGGTYNLERDANSICYSDHKNKAQASEALRQGLDRWKQKGLEERNLLARRLRNSAMTNYCWFNYDEKQKTIGGGVIAYEELYHELVGKKRQEQTLLPVPKSPLTASVVEPPILVETSSPLVEESAPTTAPSQSSFYSLQNLMQRAMSCFTSCRKRQQPVEEEEKIGEGPALIPIKEEPASPASLPISTIPPLEEARAEEVESEKQIVQIVAPAQAPITPAALPPIKQTYLQKICAKVAALWKSVKKWVVETYFRTYTFFHTLRNPKAYSPFYPPLPPR